MCPSRHKVLTIATIAQAAYGAATWTARSPGTGPRAVARRWSRYAITVRGDGEWVLIHRCLGCDEVHLNRTAGDDSPLLLLRLAVRPLAQPPFPLDLVARM